MHNFFDWHWVNLRWFSQCFYLSLFSLSSAIAMPVLDSHRHLPYQTQLIIANTPLSVEVVDNPKTRAQGLMHRRYLAPEAGMLFVFPDEAIRCFWMKNTPLDLSIAYIDQHGKIQEIHHMHAFDETPVCSSTPAMFALEVNQGWFSRKNIHPQDLVHLWDNDQP